MLMVKKRTDNVVGVGVEGGQYSTVDFGAMVESLVEEAKKMARIKQQMFT